MPIKTIEANQANQAINANQANQATGEEAKGGNRRQMDIAAHLGACELVFGVRLCPSTLGRYSDLYLDVGDPGRRTYLGMVTAMDHAVGDVVNALKEAGMLVSFHT